MVSLNANGLCRKSTAMEDVEGSVVSASELTMSSLPGIEGNDSYEQESSGLSGSVCVNEYMPWLMDEESSESVSFALFVVCGF